VNFLEEVNKIQMLLADPIKNHKIQFITDFKIKDIFSAKQCINFILFNLISNAIQYRKHDIQPQVRISAHRENESIVLRVEDNGKGIDLNSHRQDLFKPFRYFHPDSSGKGIGLYLVKLQAERLQGKIDVESSPGKGARFSVYLKD